ncbi:ornithine carbamoyltransferase [Pilibacter termitis]|uniref:Ornithine carbamoyltransferase n=1 Tax=Pilibacter termitis TaxID=263852 RepID=A0A1T4MQW7_9ENTE|nr:ornithine carbamoyltransferase [Pilibacter termitis]SJZ69510.1 ornithine carbamoyltransferase [Pilibacter termitis]
MNSLYNKDLLDLTELNKEEFLDILHTAIDMKNNREKYSEVLKGKTLIMIFEKSSTRTRISFESGMYRLGGNAIVLDSKNTQMGRGEPILDTANVMSRYADAIMIRTFSDEMVKELATHASIPVVNGLTDGHHPCQILADFQTMLEVKGSLEDLKIAYIGDGNNMAHSYILGSAILGINVSIATPTAYQPQEEIVKKAMKLAEKSGATIEITTDPFVACKDADFIFTDVWASMGSEHEQNEREKAFQTIYQVNDELVKVAKSDYHFMHCLPAHREEEVTSSIIDGEHSLIYQEAENRMHAQNALLYKLLIA